MNLENIISQFFSWIGSYLGYSNYKNIITTNFNITLTEDMYFFSYIFLFGFILVLFWFLFKFIYIFIKNVL